MSIKIGDLVTIKNNKIQVQQFYSQPLAASLEPVEVKIRKGIIFEILEIWKDMHMARLKPVNLSLTEDYVILVELSNLVKCGRAVEYLYGNRRK